MMQDKLNLNERTFLDLLLKSQVEFMQKAFLIVPEMAEKQWGYVQCLQGHAQAKQDDLNYNGMTSQGNILVGLEVMSGIHSKSLKNDPEMTELALSSH